MPLLRLAQGGVKAWVGGVLGECMCQGERWEEQKMAVELL